VTVRRRAACIALLLCSASAAGRPAYAQSHISGRVVEAETGAPVAGAEVTLVWPGGREQGPASAAPVFTVPDGSFRMAARGGEGARLRVRRLGYAAAWAALPLPGAEAIVRLERLAVPLAAIVVTAARREQRLADAVVTTELISRAQVERSGASDVAGVLTQQTGIQLEGGVPSGAGVLLQGLGAQRVLVLLDGQPVAGRVNGNLDLSRLPASLVERIEVVKGPQSTLYGSDALGGVINIVSRSPAGGRYGHASLVSGSHGRREINAAAGFTSGALVAGADAGLRKRDLAPGVPGSAGTLARRAHLAPRIGWRASATWTLEAGGLAVLERQRYRTGQLYNFSDNLQLNARAGATYRKDDLRLAPVLSWSRFDHLSRRATGPEPVSDSGAVDVQDLVQLEAPLSFGAGGAVVDAGLVLRRDAIRADRVPGGARALHSAEPYAQATWTLGALQLTPGARIAASERWGTVVTPRLAALWRPAPPLALRAAAGRGYRAPDFKELYLEFANPSAGYAVRGNPELRPETATNLTAGVEWVAATWSLRGGIFANRYRDFIETTAQDFSGTFSYANIARGSTRGLELEAGARLGPLSVEGAWSWLHTRDDSTGTPLLGRAAHSGRLAAAAGTGPLRIGSVLLVTGPAAIAREESGRASQRRGTFARLDLRAALALAGTLELSAGAENLLDREMGQDWPGYTGRQFFVGARLGGR
jgi:outer membrane receptor for ferrienterochelin and colicins